MKAHFIFIACTLTFPIFSTAKPVQPFSLSSPDTELKIDIVIDKSIHWSLSKSGDSLIAPSPIALELENGRVWNGSDRLTDSRTASVKDSFEAINYTRSTINDAYNELVLDFEEGYSLEFRAYDEAFAYRFVNRNTTPFRVENEIAEFNFGEVRQAFVPYMWDYRGGMIFNSSFEALYDEILLSEFDPDSYAMLPLLVEAENGRKLVILEADLENYPGMYLDAAKRGKALKGVFAPYPLEFEMGGFNDMNELPTKRADYIASVEGECTFPWRIVVVSDSDKELLDIDIVQKLATPSRILDTSWIKVGQSAWDWWNDWGVFGVDFKTGQNTKTYLHYIDFAAQYGLPFIVIDWGWTENTDLTTRNPEVDLQAIIEYGNEKDVGVFVWASWHAVKKSMDELFPVFESLGIAGLKIDFIDRDDQLAVNSTYQIAEKAAAHHLLVDYHGVFKPTGLQRTFPNVVGYEGVKGLENYKWADEDAPRYAVSIPFIRMVAGPMDYTPGAMHNVSQDKFAPIDSAPMSKGTRAHQVAMYVMYEAPFQMLSDSPSIYRKEHETTEFISRIPTVFDDTVALDGEVGEYAALARRKGDTWYISAMTNWNPRELSIDLSFLPSGNYIASVFKDGVNSDRIGSDYETETVEVSSDDFLTISLAPAGGWTAILSIKP